MTFITIRKQIQSTMTHYFYRQSTSTITEDPSAPLKKSRLQNSIFRNDNKERPEPEARKLLRRNPNRDPERTQSNPKEKLVILASGRPGREDCLEANYLEVERQTLMYFSEKKSLVSRERKFERNIKGRLQGDEEMSEGKCPLPRQLSKKLKPILNESKVRELKTDNKEYQQESARTIKNLKLTKDLFNIKKRMNRGSNLKILIPSEREEYYRVGEEKNLRDVFKIQSFEPPMSCVLDHSSASLLRENRRSTQPNLDTEESMGRKQKRNQSLLCNLDIKPMDKQNGLLQQVRMAKGKKIGYKLKELSNLPIFNKKSIKLARKFRVPFETYYYRDFLWKVNFTNELFVEPPLEYEHRLKAFVGKGNNSCMVRGLINRRYWFAFTDKIEEANFVWTQLKDLGYFQLQKRATKQPAKLENDLEYLNEGIFTLKDSKRYTQYWETAMRSEQNCEERLLGRLKHFKSCTIIKGEEVREGRMQNHLKNNYVIGNKKALFRTMCQYYRHRELDPFDFLPLTFHVSEGLQDPNFLTFQRYYHKRKREVEKAGGSKPIWIVKPGENSNRGNGIKICPDLKDIKDIIRSRQKWSDGSPKTFIIQAYIDMPLLYKKRKFDIRHYIVVTCINGCRKGYWFTDGYVRTTSFEYKPGAGCEAVHLTNDAVQKNFPDYGKYEKGNKLSYDQIDAYIQKLHPGKSFYRDIYPNMKAMGTDLIKASASYLDQDCHQNNFEVFGLDFMVDSSLKLWLIEANSNPCLELSCPLLCQMIPNLVENVLQATMDALFPPPVRYSPKFPRYLGNVEEGNKLQLVFDERVEEGFRGDGSILDSRLLVEEDDVFQDDGSEWEDV